MRKLVTIRSIDSISPIEGADRIEVAHIRGWQVVVAKDEFVSGQDVVFFEVDSCLPLSDHRFAFLEPRGSKIIDGSPYHRLKSIKLRGVVSQGLILPLNDFMVEIDTAALNLDDNLTSYLGVVKYEPPPLPENVIGQFFNWVPKTDAERVQNIPENVFAQLVSDGDWYATEKIDGASITIYHGTDRVRVCSRNYEVDEGDHWDAAGELSVIPTGWTVQGELAGPGIQGNRQGVPEISVYLFRAFDGNNVEVPRDEWPIDMQNMGVPLLDLELPCTVDEAIAQVDGMKSTIDSSRLAEGVVWWEKNSRVLPGLTKPEFKVISNKYLLKEK